ncbi:MAG: hypothetical protein GF411_16670 [Candidatus Lokiarchaeota archaeon]|nr:hypothetical protein [Candidatus Lokiarchaeota archaeon]
MCIKTVSAVRRMINLSKKKTKKSKFALELYERSKRGDIAGFQTTMEGYWSDKKQYPLHRIYKVIDKYWEKENQEYDLSGALILFRDGIFASLDILSFSLALDLPTEDILTILCKEKSFKDGRREVRNHCAKIVNTMIEKGDIDFLTESGLKRDGFGYLTPKLKDKRIEKFKDAFPVEKDGEYSLSKLLRSKYGKLLLRDLEVTRVKVKASDPIAKEILEKYEHMLVELELDVETLPDIQETQQLTLDGEPVSDDDSDE